MKSLFEMKDITCRFEGGIVANRNVNFEVKEGEIHALIGENGAGKSTLMKIAFGLLQPTQGELFWKGQKVHFHSAADAMAQGIGMVHQHFMLIPSFTVWENIVLGAEPTQKGTIDVEKARQKVKELSQRYGLNVDPDDIVEKLSIGEQQRVEILKALYREIDLLILDEPTSVLTPQEMEELFQTLKKLVAQKLTIIFITHKLQEVKEIAHRVTILRKGEKITQGPVDAFTIEELAHQMVGRPISSPKQTYQHELGKPLLEIRDLHVEDDRRQKALKGVQFSVKSGEIVGIAGIQGNGQSELIEAIAGLRPILKGDILFDGISILSLSPRERFLAGLAHVPEDRQRRGLILPYSIKDNLLLGRHFETRYKKNFWIHKENLLNDTKDKLKKFGIIPPQADLSVSSLSGGNQQKVVIAREFTRHAKIFLIANPTVGVDIGAIESIHSQILALQEQGAAILLISSELSELLALSHRILVLYEGQIAGELDARQTDEKEIGILMTGSRTSKPSLAS